MLRNLQDRCDPAGVDPVYRVKSIAEQRDASGESTDPPVTGIQQSEAKVTGLQREAGQRADDPSVGRERDEGCRMRNRVMLVVGFGMVSDCTEQRGNSLLRSCQDRCSRAPICPWVKRRASSMVSRGSMPRTTRL